MLGILFVIIGPRYAFDRNDVFFLSLSLLPDFRNPISDNMYACVSVCECVYIFARFPLHYGGSTVLLKKRLIISFSLPFRVCVWVVSKHIMRSSRMSAKATALLSSFRALFLTLLLAMVCCYCYTNPLFRAR